MKQAAFISKIFYKEKTGELNLRMAGLLQQRRKKHDCTTCFAEHTPTIGHGIKLPALLVFTTRLHTEADVKTSKNNGILLLACIIYKRFRHTVGRLFLFHFDYCSALIILQFRDDNLYNWVALHFLFSHIH